MTPTFTYLRPGSIREAVRLLAAPGACAHAGGTDILGCLRDGVLDATTLVSLSGLGELEGVTERADGTLRIGARATLEEVASHPGIRARWSAVAQGATEAARPQRRSQGTIGGNLCQRPRCRYFRDGFPCVRRGGGTCFAINGENELHAIFGGSSCHMVHPSDIAAPLMALDAQVRIAGPNGAWAIPIESFFVLPSQDARHENVLGPGEIVIDVIVPAPAASLKSSYTKARRRGASDVALAAVALAIERPGVLVQSARVVLSGVAPIPWRVKEVEAALLDKPITPATVSAAAEAAAQGAEPLEQNGYKVDLVRGIVEAALLALQA
jgi:xanthine dehydrogenase YagS FAD-binding subunit